MHHRHAYGKRTARTIARVLMSAYRVLRVSGYAAQAEQCLQKACEALCRAGLPATREAALGAQGVDIEAENAADLQDADAVDAAHALVALSSGCDATRSATLRLRALRQHLRQHLLQRLLQRQRHRHRLIARPSTVA